MSTMNAGFLYVHVFTGHILLKFLLEQEFYFHYIDHMLAARCYKTRSQLEAARGVALFGSRSKGKSWKICISYNLECDEPWRHLSCRDIQQGYTAPRPPSQRRQNGQRPGQPRDSTRQLTAVRAWTCVSVNLAQRARSDFPKCIQSSEETIISRQFWVPFRGMAVKPSEKSSYFVPREM